MMYCLLQWGPPQEGELRVHRCDIKSTASAEVRQQAPLPQLPYTHCYQHKQEAEVT
jgi:hypothetical protein